MKAILVVGPCSSGTRLLHKILNANGCKGAWQSEGHVQFWDKHKIEGDPIVWRRSVPHQAWWLELSQLLERLKDYDDIRGVIPIRDMWCLTHSQVHMGHARTISEAKANIERAHSLIVPQFLAANIPFQFVSYESLILHPDRAQRGLCSSLGLEFKVSLDIVNQNTKHWATI